MKPQLVIRKGTVHDMCEVLALIKELAIYEREPEAVDITEAHLIEHGFGAYPMFETLVAEYEGSIVGMALYYPRYSTWKGPTLHLEDLIVKEKFRRKSIGEKLFSRVIEIGKQRGVKRIEWAVLNWNTPAIEFYKQAGATVFEEWRIAQMNEESINNYLKNRLDSETI